MIFTVIGAFVLYGIYYAMNASVISQMPALAAQLSYSIASGFSTILYQYVHFSCICRDVSGYAGNALLHYPNQDEMDGDCLCDTDAL